MSPASAASSTRFPQAAPFDSLADIYDELFTHSLIGRAQRHLVWKAIDEAFRPGQRILEINCGTGVDAIHLGSRGISVLACDAAPRMVAVARQRASEAQLPATPEFRVLTTERVAELEREGPFDGVLSNFGGLNCVAELRSVARDLAALLRPGGFALLCFLGPFCACETLWYLGRGNPRKAFRRMKPGGTIAKFDDNTAVRVHYPSPRAIARAFAPEFSLKTWRGVGVSVPPSYLEAFAQHLPRVLAGLARADRWLGRCPLLRGMADHVLMKFERTRA